MKLCIYRGLDGVEVPKNVTHVIVDSSVTVIKERAFISCEHVVSVIMGDNVKRIEEWAFCGCDALRYVRLSKTLEHIGEGAFQRCESLEALFLPSTLKSIQDEAFADCDSFRLLILSHDIDLSNVGMDIISSTAIYQIAEAHNYFGDPRTDPNGLINHRVNEWLFHHMDVAPFHKLCYNSYITTQLINDYLIAHGDDAALQIDPHHGMTPLHILSMNPHAPVHAILALLKANINAASVRDHEGKTPLYYALHYNPYALVRMISCLREHGIENEILSLFLVIPDDDDDTPLHVLAKNPFAPANAMAVLLGLKLEAAFHGTGMSPLDCARECNVNGLIAMILVLCNHRNSTVSMDGGDLVENNMVVRYSKKRKVQGKGCLDGFIRIIK